MYRMVLCLVLLVCAACSNDNPDDEIRVPRGDPRELPKVAASADSIRGMLRERFGERVARNLRIGVQDAGGVRVIVHGEVPNEEIRAALLNELSARIEGLRFEDFDLRVSGPIGLLFGFDAPLGGNPVATVFSPDLRLAATANGHIYEMATGRRLNRLPIVARAAISSIAFSPDGALLATGHQDGQIVLWDMPLGLSQRELSASVGSPGIAWVMGLQFTANGERLVSLNRQRGEVHVWNVADGSARLIGTHVPASDPDLGAGGYRLAVSPKGETVASSSDRDDAVILWDVERRSERARLTVDGFFPEALVWSADGKFLAAARLRNPQPGTVVLWTADGKKARSFPSDAVTAVDGIALSNDSRTLAVRYRGGGVRLFDVESGDKWLDIARDRIGAGGSLRFSPNGNVLATDSGLQPSGIRLWDVSERPGAPRERAALPPAYADLAPRDDLLVQTIERSIRGTFDRRNIEALSVEFLSDGGVRLVGKVSSQAVKDSAGTTAATQGAPGERVLAPRRVVNDLEVTGRYGPP